LDEIFTAVADSENTEESDDVYRGFLYYFLMKTLQDYDKDNKHNVLLFRFLSPSSLVD